MIHVVTPELYFLYRQEIRDMYRLRHRVFRERMGWEVSSVAGEERDRFDELGPIYLLSINNKGQVDGSWRFLPTTGSYMLRDVFPELLEGRAAPRHPRIWEGSRFAVETAPTLGGPDARAGMPARLILCAVIELCLALGVRQLITVYDARMARLLPRLGCPPIWQSQAKRIGRTSAYMGEFEMSTGVLGAIRSLAGIEGSVIHSAPFDRDAMAA